MRTLLAAFASFAIASTALAATKPAPKPAVAKVSEIDRLFSDLAKVDEEEEAKPIEQKILAAFLRSGSPTVDLLMARAAASVNSGDADTAKKLIASVNDIAPDYAEAWHQRGILQAASGDDQGAMFCLEKAVELNPRHFEAMAELAVKLEEYGDKPGALKLYRKALALDPHFDDIARKERQLAHEVEGESL
ncbi:MAG TPA: tetratricopeptide repeat protein [Rhizomicrobium sp.]|nr:tetratricopeptide repeat protein [Rhizomicrobium sp.]